MPDPLDTFSPPVRVWFRETFGQPTPPQAQGWLPIQRGEHTLILAPTGSGKTLAAFLWGIDKLYRTGHSERSEESLPAPVRPCAPLRVTNDGVRLLYVSPLKALNNDIERNLRAPLEGIRAVAARLGQVLPALRVAVRTGDTPSHARAQMWKRPPHILITTPESLYLMLTSLRAREMFRAVRTIIVDEIHTLSGTKRGVHLSLSLERLCHLASERVQRIGLSATIKPLEEAARFLVGQDAILSNSRPVTIVNAGYHKPIDLQVITAVEDFRDLPGETVWPAVVPRVLQDIRAHRSTLIFCNNRRLAERTADRLNAQLTAEESEEIPPGSIEVLAPGGIPRDRGIFAIGAAGPIRAHHGSMSKEARRKMEEDLKAGRLPALVGTSSLELGIDIGAVDLVVQLQSPKSVAQGLQRVGRSGHLVGQTSVGRIYATFREDLVEAAAVARGMIEDDVEPTYTPQNSLDVLAQQIVAMVACEDWSAPALFDLVRRAYAYRDLSRESFYSVLEMLSGKYERVRARIVWDRVHDRLTALPGSRLLAMMNAGTISDTGVYSVYLSDGKTKVGELDEEFVFETRVGDAFLLGSRVWRVFEITNDRIVVGDASGAVPRMPFWNGDYPWRQYDLGVRIGRFRREIAERIVETQHTASLREIEQWLQREYALDENSVHNLVAHVSRQLDAVGVLSSDTTIVVESFQDAVGEPRLVIHSPFGGRVNGAWALALSSALRERVGVEVETQTNDDGIIFRFLHTQGEPPVDIVRQMTAAEARERILRELPNSALFGAHFRMNAARALLLPKARGRKRTPFWLQRLKAKDLLALVRQFDDFPIVAETYRDCLRDVLDLPHLEEILQKVSSGEIRVVPIETTVPSPVAAGLLFQFIGVYMYEWDAPKAERQLQSLSLHREVLDDLLASRGVELRDLLKPEAVAEVQARGQHLAAGYQARTAEELALYLRELGDLTTDEVAARCAGDGRAWLAQLSTQDRVIEMAIPTRRGSETRWVPAELADEYRALTSLLTPLSESPLPSPDELHRASGGGAKGVRGEAILHRFLRVSGPLTRDVILDRYAFPESWLDEMLARLVASREIVHGHFTPTGDQPLRDEFCDRHNLEHIHRRTLTLLRKEVQPVSLYAYADFLTRWQHLHPHARLTGTEGLRKVLQQLRGAVMPGIVWERDALPGRLADYAPDNLDALCESGELVWVGSGQDPRRGRVRFFFRGEGGLFLDAPDESELGADARAIYEYLKTEGASFTVDLQAGLGMKRNAIGNALIELVMAGLVTNDSLDTLRTAVVGAKHASPLRSPLETDLAARLQTPRPLTRSRYRDAKRRVAQRLRTESEMPQQWQGRWSLTHRAGVLGQPLSDEERADKLTRVLLARYGVVTRECLEREEGTWHWACLYAQLLRMEMRGEVRRGYFVASLSGTQFALPEAVERLRASSASADDALIVLNAADPATLLGAELPNVPLRFARLPSTHCVLWRGQPILVAEDNGERITTVSSSEPDALRRALQAYLARPNAPRHSVVALWNGAPVLGSAGEPLLQSLDFHRTPTGMEWWV
jgi:ATP-dependent Lhr-like helicase